MIELDDRIVQEETDLGRKIVDYNRPIPFPLLDLAIVGRELGYQPVGFDGPDPVIVAGEDELAH